ncbi:MAG: glutathione transferase GstA [Kofleriaceae bacterium]|nr:MAG: glutathione transferase GstA [Kofleriaceae bacterium]MBZ0231700.1 glutathione transferase GstA [Kofleriaceae bacterium]
MKLYYSPAACSLAVHIVAREADLPLELIEVDLRTHRLADGTDYYTINPRGYVPMLELDDGTRLTEVAALVQYLADLAPEAALVPPAGTIDRVRVQGWLTFVSSELHKTFSPWLWHKETAESTKQDVLGRLARHFAELDALLAQQPYLAGETFTVADAYAFTIIRWSPLLRVELKPYPTLGAYLARIAQRPRVREALVAEGLVKKAA